MDKTLCLLCGRPAESGLRCNKCRQAANFEAYLREPPAGEHIKHTEWHPPTQEELDAIPF